MTNTRWSTSSLSPVIALPTSANSRAFCLCDYATGPCSYFEMAFVDFSTVTAQTDEYINDYRKFLLSPLDASSAWSFTLIASNGTEYNIYDSVNPVNPIYGEIYQQGFNVSQPLQVGINIQWYKVANAIGYGDYTVKLSQTDFGNTVENTTHSFRVVPYDVKRANGTVKIEVDNVGVTMNGTNWTGLIQNSLPVFTNMIRVKGRMNLLDPEIEIESIEDGNRKEIPIQTKLTDVFSISIERLPYLLGQALIHEDISMNWIVTDYNVFNEDLRNEEMIIQTSAVTITPDYARKSYELTGKRNISKLNRKFV